MTPFLMDSAEQAMLKFLDAKLAPGAGSEGIPSASRLPLSSEARMVLLRVLTQAAPLLPPDAAADLSRLNALAQVAPSGGVPAAASPGAGGGRSPPHCRRAASRRTSRARPTPTSSR